MMHLLVYTFVHRLLLKRIVAVIALYLAKIMLWSALSATLLFTRSAIRIWSHLCLNAPKASCIRCSNVAKLTIVDLKYLFVVIG